MTKGLPVRSMVSPLHTLTNTYLLTICYHFSTITVFFWLHALFLPIDTKGSSVKEAGLLGLCLVGAANRPEATAISMARMEL